MKKGLGRGFDSLIPTTLIDETFDPTAAQDGKLSKLQELPIDDIQADPEQPRRLFDEGALAELPATLEPLANLKSSISVLSGLTQQNAFALGDGPGDHARSTAAWLTGVHPKKTAGADIRNGISADQVAAQKIGQLTRFPSLEIGCERGAQAGDCDSGYSCAYSSSISWRSESTPVAKEVNPRLVFERFFGSGDAAVQDLQKRDRYRKTILDSILDDAAKLNGQLGNRDRQKMDEYFTAIREIEERLARAEKENPVAFLPDSKRPSSVPKDYGEHIRLLGDMMILAFQADLTRVCTFMFANDGSNRPYPMIGISEGHHDISHHGRDAVKLQKKQQIDRFHIEQLAYVLEKMQSIKEGEGTLLDHSMIVYGAGISDGDRHNHDDLPMIVAGRDGGVLSPGRSIRAAPGTPMCNLFTTMLRAAGADDAAQAGFGDSTGELSGV